MSRHRQDFYYTRKVFSWLFFLIGVGCVIAFFVNGMTNFIFLELAFFFFIWAYFISPHRRNSSSEVPDLWIDEWLIEFVFKLITWPFRIIKAIFKEGPIDFSF